MRNRYYIIGALVFILLLVIGVYFYLNSRQLTSVKPENVPTPISFEKNNNVPSQSFKDQMQYQSQADHNFGQWQNDLYKNYPWYNRLPIQNDKYYVYFDTTQKKFIGQIYVQAEQDTIKKEVDTTLRGYGVDTNKYPVVWSL